MSHKSCVGESVHMFWNRKKKKNSEKDQSSSAESQQVMATYVTIQKTN